MHTVLDKGPPEPKPLVAEASEEEKFAHAALVKAHHDWHEAHKEPVEVQMHALDYNTAASAGSERFELVERSTLVHKAGSVEDRMSAVEERLDFIENGGEYEEVPLNPNAPEGTPRQWRRKMVEVKRPVSKVYDDRYETDPNLVRSTGGVEYDRAQSQPQAPTPAYQPSRPPQRATPTHEYPSREIPER